MSYEVRFAARARADLKRLYGFLLSKDVNAAERALHAIRSAMKLLEEFPFSCRKADADNTFLREMIIQFGSSGYVVLFEIDREHVTILALRHQFEDDFF